MTSIDNTVEFTDEQVSEWILHKIWTNTTYLDSMSKVNDIRWYSNEYVGMLISVIVTSYKRHGTKPTRDSVIGNLKYLVENDKINLDFNTLVETLDYCIQLVINIDENTIKEAIELFVKKGGAYYLINNFLERSANLDKRKKKLSFEDTLHSLNKVNDFQLDNDIGFDFFTDTSIQEEIDFLTNPTARLRFGDQWLNIVTSGGLPIGGNCLMLFQGNTNIGKSVSLAWIAYQVLCMNKVVVLYTCELDTLGYGRRLMSLITDLPIDFLNDKAFEMRDRINKFKKQNPNARLIIKEFPMSGTTVNMLDNNLEALENDGIKPDLIVVDYLTLLSPSNCSEREQRFVKIGIISEQLRALSKKYKAPLVSAVQSNRSGYDTGESKLSSMADSLGPAKAADLIIGISAYDEDEANGNVRFTILKSRMGHKNYTPHMYHMNVDTLMLEDAGDAVDVDEDDAESITNSLASFNQKNSKIYQTKTPVVQQTTTPAISSTVMTDGIEDIF